MVKNKDDVRWRSYNLLADIKKSLLVEKKRLNDEIKRISQQMWEIHQEIANGKGEVE